jgi:hypothetical protein
MTAIAVVVLDGVGDFHADYLDDVIDALLKLREEVKQATPDWMACPSN